MNRPTRIYELLSKVADGTFLNDKEFFELQQYITELERKANALSESTSPAQSK